MSDSSLTLAGPEQTPQADEFGGRGRAGHLTRWAAASCWVQMPVLTDHPAVRIPAGTGSARFPRPDNQGWRLISWFYK